MIAPRKLTVAVLLHVAALKAGTDVWFAPLDPAPRPGVNYTGPPDFAGLFDSQTPWEKAASRIQVFSVHTRWVLAASESGLRKMIDGLADRKIALAVFADAFAGAAACGQGVGGFGAELPLASTLGAVRRLKSFGAALEYITLNQPIYTGTMYQGSNACRWTPEVMAANAATRVREIRGEFPYVGIGVMEPLPAPGPVEWKDSYAAGIEALQTAFGFALAFFQVNVDWNRTDAMSAVETASRSLAKEFGMPLGVIYSGAATDVSDTSWLSNAESRLQRLELEKGLIPDQVVFQSTHAYPTKLLPETDPTSFTGWLNRYFRARTVLTAAVNLPAIRGVLLSSDGEPVPDAPITVSAVSMEGLGLSKTYRATGKVPEGANRILFGIRVNLECIDCGGVANVSVSSFRYSDERQSSPIERNFAAGMLGWANSSPASGRNSTSLTKAELRIAASPDQQFHINGSEIPIAAGTNFEFTAVARMGPGTGNSGYLCVIFLGQADSGSKEIARATIPFQPPSPVESGTTTTSAAGAWSTPLLRSADRIGLAASFPGPTR